MGDIQRTETCPPRRIYEPEPESIPVPEIVPAPEREPEKVPA